MARRKKDVEEIKEVEETVEESSDEGLDEAIDTEQAEAEAASTEEDEAETEAEATPEPKAKPRKRRQRKSRKPKTAAFPLLMESTSEEEPNEEESDEREATRKASADADIREDATMASAAIQKSMDSMVKQWAAIKDISGAISTNLQNVSAMLQGLPTNYTVAMHEMLKQQPPQKPTLINRVALGISGIALILSVLGLSFSQSARQKVLSNEIARVSNAQAPVLSHEPFAPFTFDKGPKPPLLPPRKNSKPRK